MPGKIKVKVLAGRNLPVMDRSSDTTDAYVEIKFGNTTYKTDVCRKSLNPQWNSEWYKFEVEDSELQDEPLQIRLMDHDTYSANDAIGKVYINLNPLLLPGVPPPVKNIWTLEASMNSSTGAQGGLIMTGWLPVYDTMHGIRGEVNIIVKVELFLDFNKFRQSSCGVTFFYSPIVPHGYHAQVIHGFVEELVIGDDPEYKWIDKIRTPRASNEARQTVFLKLSNEVQRKIGLKALDLGGNAVIGYLQNFDLEGESGIVARGIGTVVTLVKLHDFPNFVSETTAEEHALNKPNKQQHSSDCSESDSSPHLLLRQHHYSSISRADTSPVASPTVLGNKFPLYGDNVATVPKTPLKYAEYKSTPRQSSVQSYSSHTKYPPLFSGSSLSLSDDVIDENSLRMMLAIEDMRGESQGNRLTRGLRNLRHLPQRVLRSRNVDSLDEESDLENVSIHSSTWSIVTTESTAPEFPTGSFKRKRFRKKPQGEGMAAMLIRSMHASALPLDSVREDRETPTPSPVNFIDPPATIELQPESFPATITELPELPEPPNDEPGDAVVGEPANKTLLVTYSKLKNSSEDEDIAPIPMISSSESDTSSDEENDEEEEDIPSESSTNYNILDDTQSLLDPSSPEAENCPSFDSQMMMANKKENEDDDVKLIEDKINETYLLFVNKAERKADESVNLIESKDEDVVRSVDKSYTLLVNKDEDGKSIDGRDEERIELISSNAEGKLNLISRNEANEVYLVEGESEETINLIDAKDEDIAQLIESKNEEIISLIESESQKVPDLIEDKEEEIVSSVNVENKVVTDSVEQISEETVNFFDKENNKNVNLISHEEEEIVCLVESDDEEKFRLLESTSQKTIGSKTGKASELIEHEDKEVVNLIDSDNEGKFALIDRTNKSEKRTKNEKKPSVDEMLSSEFSSDVDSDRPASAIPAEYKPKRSSNPFKSTKPIQERQRTLPEPLLSGSIEPPAEYSNNGKPSRHRLHKQVSMLQVEEGDISESSEEEYHPKHHQKSSKLVEKKPVLINFDGDEQLSNKASRKIERTDTVIYKGPKQLLLDMSNTDAPSSPTPLSPVVLTPSSASVPVTPISGDTNHLRLPTVSLLDVVPKTPYMIKSKTEDNFKFPDEARVADMLYKKYRRTCMLDLIKVIDSRMLVHQHHHESTRRTKRPHVTKKNNTPSPDSSHRKVTHHRRSRSRSPDTPQHHHHHHHHKLHESTTKLHKHDSEISIVESHATKPPQPPPPALVDSPKPSPTSNISNSAVNHDETNQCVFPTSPVRRQHNQQEQPASPANKQQQIQQTQQLQNSPASRNPVSLHRRSSDSDLSITPKDNKSFVKKGRSFRIRSDRSRQSSRPSSRYSSRLMLSAASSGNSLTGSDRSMGGYLKPTGGLARTMNQEALEMLEYPFITMQQYPPGFVLHIGGFISARSVKLLERISNLEEPEGRDLWWTEIRMEVRSHARALACNVVIGYREETSICDDVCVLSGFGTAAVINLHSTGQDQDNVLITHVQGPMTTSVDSSDKLTEPKTPSSKSAPKDCAPEQNNVAGTPASTTTNHKPKQRLASDSNEHDSAFGGTSSCSLCHLPYSKSSMNFQVCVSKCAVCRRAKVPDVLFTTVELPENIPMTGRGCFIQATVCKSKKDLRGELNAKEISDCLPFLEYEMHSLLLNKLRMRGMNAIFGLKVQVSIGERLVIGMAVGTAVYLTALPQPSPPQIATGNSWNNEEQLAEIQKSLVDTVIKNVEFYQLKPLQEVENGKSMSDTDESEDELPELDLGLGMKDVCVLEVDDVEDLDRINLLMDERPPNDFHVVNTEVIPGLEDLEIVRNLQMFTQVSRAKIPVGQPSSMPSKYFARLLQTVYFKLRRMVPCALCDLQFKVSMPEPDEIQLSVVGMALGLGEPTKYNKFRRRLLSHSISKDQVKRAGDDNDLIFSLDEDHAENFSSGGESQPTLNAVTQKPRPRSPLRIKHTTHRHKHVPLKERYGVDITPLSYLPGGRIERYLGNLNFFFIRESNSIRENGGLSGFIHSFVTEVLAIVRAHVTALGGNAMVAFFMSQCVLLNSPHKNQGQCLINVGGDVVCVSYFGNDGKPPPPASATAAANC